jgi:hypothetical protein
MKSLVQYINESFETFKVKDLVVKYNCRPNDEFIQFYIPESYSEDNFMIYLGDLFFNELPASDKFSEDEFGKNASKIYDVYFEYDRYEKGVESTGDFIDWRKDLDTNHDNNDENEEFNFVQVKGLRYVISFDEFELKDEDSSDIDEALSLIFNATNANDNNKYPLEITFDEKNISYKTE